MELVRTPERESIESIQNDNFGWIGFAFKIKDRKGMEFRGEVVAKCNGDLSLWSNGTVKIITMHPICYGYEALFGHEEKCSPCPLKTECHEVSEKERRPGLSALFG